MTAFTIGHTESYDTLLRDGYRPDQGMPEGQPPTKIGRREGYEGGSVFATAEDAAKYLLECNCEQCQSRSVYELDADYDADCYQVERAPFRSLLRDVRIVRKVEIFDSTINQSRSQNV